MDEETRLRLERLEALAANNIEAIRQTQVAQDRNAEAIKELRESIGDLKEAQSQELPMISELRRAIVDERRLISDVRSEQASHAEDPDAHSQP